MKSQFSFKYVLGSVAFISQLISGISVAVEPEISTNSSLCRLLNIELDPFQRYIETRFIKSGCTEPVYLQGELEEKITLATDFTLLNLNWESNTGNQIDDLAYTILTENTDVVCIHDLIADNDAYNLYKVIRSDYAHFIYIPPATTLNLLEGSCENGILIASKYRMDQAHFNTFQEDQTNGNEGFFDFVLKNATISLGHIYATNLKKNSVNESTTFKVLQMIEKIQSDSINLKEESIPFVLCGDLKSLQVSQETKIAMEACFRPQCNISFTNCTLTLQSLPLLLNANFGHTVSNTSITMSNHHSKSRSLIKRAKSRSNNHDAPPIISHQQTQTVQKMNAFIMNEFKILPIRSHKDRNEDRGGASCEGGISGKWGDGKGIQWEGYVKGEAHDGKGNYAEGRVTQKDDGTGEVNVHGGHESKNR